MNLLEQLGTYTTEDRNELTTNIDIMSTIELLTTINNEDKKVAIAVEQELKYISLAVDIITEKMLLGGRLIYCGAGTSGRLGVLDASECPPTYGVDYNTVIGIMAGGNEALLKAKEGVEDSLFECKKDLINIDFNKNDVLVGIAASGRTPYVLGGFIYAKEIGAKTISLTCNNNSAMSKVADIAISVVVGPEVVTGSTRMKSGTAQKMVLNMLSTATMIKKGKVYKNLMVDVKPSNEKLVERAKKIVIEATGIEYDKAEALLHKTENNVKLAIFMELSSLPILEAKKILNDTNGHLSSALKLVME